MTILPPRPSVSSASFSPPFHSSADFILKATMRLLLLFILLLLCLSIHNSVSALGFVPIDNYLIDCGSYTNTTVGNRTFSADTVLPDDTLSTPRSILANTSSTAPFPSTYYDPSLFLTARIFDGASHYRFPIREKGRHLVRLYFYPFVFESYNMSRAAFSVSAQNITLLQNFRIGSGSIVKEYSINVTTDEVVITFTPERYLFAFVNALEVTSLPPEVIPYEAITIDTPARARIDFRDRALETVARVNMGNETVLPRSDPLWRLWVPDGAFLRLTKVLYLSEPEDVRYETGGPTENVAPELVYGTATTADTSYDPLFSANLTWQFRVDPGFEYLVRFHFCDVTNFSSLGPFMFQVYLNSRFAYRNLNLDNLTAVGTPYIFDAVTSQTDGGTMTVSLGPSTDAGQYPRVFLNGLEIMKLSNSKVSLDGSNMETESSGKKKIIVLVGSAIGVFTIAAVAAALALFLIRKKRRKLAVVREEHCKDRDAETSMFSSSTIGYKFPLRVIEEATDKFSENRIIGTGGFGKVYEGVLRDGTKVAVKRGSGKSNQGLQEFRTEIKMLSQFRHRHLVSLIGYCDEQDEMIIIYEFMANGTVKNHLYRSGPESESESNIPVLSWRQRLEICIGSAKGLHYLHTGPAKAIIHRDVKTANILLDENFMAKVADFGLSKPGPDLNKTHVSTAIKGSFGYLDPEYLIRQRLTEKSDVYSFGVVMLEILSGRPVIDPSRPREEANLVIWALKWRERGKIHGIVDPRIVGQMTDESLCKFVEIAEKCLSECGLDRPSMGDVLWNLESTLRLEVKEMKPSRNEGFLSVISRSEISAPTPDFSTGSMMDLAGVPMSKVFARMVKEEMR